MIKKGNGISHGLIHTSLLKPEIVAQLQAAQACAEDDVRELANLKFLIYADIVHMIESDTITHLAVPVGENRCNLNELSGNATAYDVPPEWRKVV